MSSLQDADRLCESGRPYQLLLSAVPELTAGPAGANAAEMRGVGGVPGRDTTLHGSVTPNCGVDLPGSISSTRNVTSGVEADCCRCPSAFMSTYPVRSKAFSFARRPGGG